jgi:lysyl-tRNA synthetase class 2
MGKKGAIDIGGEAMTIPKKFQRITFAEVLRRYAQVLDYENETRDSLALRAAQLGVKVEAGEPKGKIADEMYKKICRPHIKSPTFIVGHPVDISPLAKRIARESSQVRRFQLIIGGYELVNAYSELNDPREQRARFEEQQRGRAKGEEETHPFDEGFIEALEHGMPPAAGAAIGIDRLIMLLTNTHNIREVILFPTLKPKQ